MIGYIIQAMRYTHADPRQDDPASVMALKDKNKGGIALIVLGGYSAVRWEELYAEIKPDVLLCANGANSLVYGSDYWMIAENMARSNSLAQKGDPAARRFMEMFHREAGAKTKLVSHRSWNLLQDARNCIRIRRCGFEEHEIEENFSFREYDLGYLAGWVIRRKEAGVDIHVGTVGAQLIHHAGILGCAKVHTIGFDLMFRDDTKHHAYDYPPYKEDVFRTEKFRLDYKGAPTQWAWVETAQWLKSIEYLFKRDGLGWVDHSDGLLKIEGLECANAK